MDTTRERVYILDNENIFNLNLSNYTPFFLMSLLRNHVRKYKDLMPWDYKRPLDANMPELMSLTQSNTVTRHSIINRKTGKIFPLNDINGQRLVDLTKTTRTVQDIRFKQQLILGISTFGNTQFNKKKKRNTILISLTGVVVTTGAASNASALNSVAATSRIINTNIYDADITTCHANLITVNAPTCGYFSKQIDLKLLAKYAQADSNNVIVYEPDVFPGVRIRNTKTKGAATFYCSGKFLMIGLVHHSDIQTLLTLLHPWIKAAMK